MRCTAVLALLLALAASAVTVGSSQRIVTVGQSSGKFNYNKIQDAVDSVPANNAGGRVVINVMSGTYR
jgi:pectin methylesterase-like acyl-CoA thioesterase